MIQLNTAFRPFFPIFTDFGSLHPTFHSISQKANEYIQLTAHNSNLPVIRSRLQFLSANFTTTRWLPITRTLGRFPFTQIFRKFREEIKWNGPFRLEIFRKKRTTFSDGPHFSAGPTGWSEICRSLYRSSSFVNFTTVSFCNMADMSKFMLPMKRLSFCRPWFKHSLKAPMLYDLRYMTWWKRQLPRQCKWTHLKPTEISDQNFRIFWLNGKQPSKNFSLHKTSITFSTFFVRYRRMLVQ